MTPLEPTLPAAVQGLAAALLGATLGSFLNVVVARVPAGESIVRPRSRCPRCRAGIAWYDNLPVISWLALRGRCRRCGAPISLRYPLVELLGAAAAWLAWRRHGLALPALAELVMVDLLVALAFIDLATWLLPAALTRPLVVTGVLAAAAGAAPAPALRSSALGAAVGFAAFALVAWIGRLVARKEAMGAGDVWLVAGIGAWQGVGALLPVVLLASVQGSVYGLALLALGRSEPGPAPAGGAGGATGEPAASEREGGDERPAAPAEAAGDDAPRAADAEDDWVPPRHAVPFGPFLVAGALEWLYLSGWLSDLVPALGAFE
ncbi:MAG TPA: prepilin peptidase [Anaeromyxobacter sp.]|nr:prepilin peptidase [Anaeromyxobacter sp.]